MLARISHASEKSGLTSPGMDLQIPSLARNLEPTLCVGTWNPRQSVGEEGNGQGRPFPDHFSPRAKRAGEKYGLGSAEKSNKEIYFLMLELRAEPEPATSFRRKL